MKRLNAGPFHGLAGNAYIQTGPVKGDETSPGASFQYILSPEVLIDALGRVNVLS